MKRVINPSKYLKGVIKENQPYYIGFGSKALTPLGKNHPEIKDMLAGKKQRTILTGKAGPLKENTAGKYVRKQPEKKTSIWKHIEYYSYRWERWINYDREFSIWEKELLHQYQLSLQMRKTPQGEIIFIFPQFVMADNEKHYLLAGAAMNMSCALSNYFLMYNEKLEPIIPITKYEEKSLLPSGIGYKSVQEKLDTIEKAINGEPNYEATGNSYRFAVLKEYSPSDVTIGTGGFNEYLRFEFKQYNLLVFENLKSGNATYIFKLSKFDFNKHLDKQNAMADPAFLKRVIHENMDSWESQMGRFFR